MKKQVNPMLRLGCILLLAGGVVSGVLNLLAPAILLLGFTSLDNSMYEYAESEMREVTDGLLGAEVALGVIFGVVILLITIFAVMLVIDVAVALLGLRRAGRPEKYGFFLVWGVVLLVIGVSGALYIGISSLNGLAGLVCGVAAPILFLVGAFRQKKLLRDAQPIRQSGAPDRPPGPAI